ncbi:fucose 4-O-acetylase [Saccharibacillus sp. O16]|nr:fucose 4-O-acetylase [Saccharibacillus sp. O16]
MAQRDAYFDNMKFLLIALVVIGHLIEPLSGQAAFRPLYLFIYSFHIPLFVLISGFFCKKITSSDYRIKVVGSLIVPYLIFESLYSLFDYFVMDAEQLRFSYFTPNWLMWFIFSMIIWKMLLPYAVKIRWALPISFAVAILAGYAADAQYYASISRTIVFFPFFLAGYYLDKSMIDRVRTSGFRLLSAIVLCASIFVMIKYEGRLNPEWFYGSLPYRAIDHPEWTAGVYRIAAYAAAVLIGGSVMILMTSRNLPYVSALGRYTLYAYLLHGFVAKGMIAAGFYEQIGESKAALLLIPLGVLLTAVLSSSFVRRRFRWLLEPKLKGLFKRSSPDHGAETGR